MLRRSCLALVAVAFTVVACSSLPELSFGDPDGGPIDGAGGEGGLDGGRDTAPACVSSGPEVCDDGIDNDCNGLADCADPACGTFACVAPAPDSWELVAFAETAPPACPTGYTAPVDLKVVPGSIAHSCPCTCDGSGGSGPTCAGATSSVTTGDDNQCLANQTTATGLNSNTGAACAPLAADLLIGSAGSTGYAKLTSPAGPATCTPNATITKSDPTNGRACTPPTKSGAGCTATSKCLPKAPGFTMCISKAGEQVCPTGFAKRNLAGTTAADTRACLPCTCSKTGCTGDLTLWSNSMCNAKSTKLTTAANAACGPAQATSDTNVTAKFYKSTITGGCAIATPATAQGTLTFGGERTICCK